jgi:hypothetical protein
VRDMMQVCKIGQPWGLATCSIIIIMSDERGRSERGSSRAGRERQRQLQRPRDMNFIRVS